MLRLGLRVSLATDDEGILGNDIVNEYAMAIAHSDITYEELKAMTMNSVETSFLDADSRRRLGEDLNRDFERFERAWSLRVGRRALPSPN
jgi:adenosine deaminase